ncbi:DeoR/GlpR family DNA-binding transcription regulator [Ligilactobacillus sp. WILCCON 0076]|uniref:DeoR/GlpR family DNA-binding transcription regulator n=1 Tax=Ligilactobacillus ubinensis TaxID=2876789 RepID=A0A9X2FM02_9LACO|nr:DeoR/GlpR family DNA-binding transcription regulator [Ligilactobacillus ubinensis]MCP0888071.1 DeoR/GlpR family DNA-binding transcription regulator [Ligilactobacillus ubinensis]
MLKEERISAIADYIKEMQTVSMADLVNRFGVSPNTLRRDLSKLLENGNFKKIYGGVTVNNNNKSLIDYTERKSKTSKDKISIGKVAASLFESGDLIFLDSGTTTDAISNFLPRNISYTLITNSLQLIVAASELSNVKLLIIGNQFNPKTQSFTGTDEDTLFNKYNINKAFMSATGISLNNGVTNSEFNEFKIKSQVLTKSLSNPNQENILLIDHTKFDRTALLTYAQINQFSKIITSGEAPLKYKEYFEKNNIELINSHLKTKPSVNPHK